MEIIATFQSLKQARRLLDELAVQGGWDAAEMGEYSVMYRKERDQVVETLSIHKKDRAQWQVIKSQEARMSQLS